MRVIPRHSNQANQCLSCGQRRRLQTGACSNCGSETHEIEVESAEAGGSVVNREHWGFE